MTSLKKPKPYTVKECPTHKRAVIYNYAIKSTHKTNGLILYSTPLNEYQVDIILDSFNQSHPMYTHKKVNL